MIKVLQYMGRKTKKMLSHEIAELEVEIKRLRRQMDVEFWKLNNPPKFKAGYEDQNILVAQDATYKNVIVKVSYFPRTHNFEEIHSWEYMVFLKNENALRTMYERDLIERIKKQEDGKENK